MWRAPSLGSSPHAGGALARRSRDDARSGACADVSGEAHGHCRTRKLSEVVPLQVDDHHVLGGVLLARQEFAGAAFVLDRRSTAGPRALDRTGLDLPAADSEEPF